MRLRHLLLLTALIPVAACNDDDLLNNWEVNIDTVTVFSATRPDLIGRPSAVNFADLPTFALPVETPTATGRWDVVLTDASGTMSFVPASAFSGLDNRSAIVTLQNRTLEEVDAAPGDTALYKRTATPIQMGNVYIIRTRRIDCGGVTGVRYGKFEPVEIDAVNGRMRIRSVVNPFCNVRNLIPKD